MQEQDLPYRKKKKIQSCLGQMADNSFICCFKRTILTSIHPSKSTNSQSLEQFKL